MTQLTPLQSCVACPNAPSPQDLKGPASVMPHISWSIAHKHRCSMYIHMGTTMIKWTCTGTQAPVSPCLVWQQQWADAVCRMQQVNCMKLRQGSKQTSKPCIPALPLLKGSTVPWQGLLHIALLPLPCLAACWRCTWCVWRPQLARRWAARPRRFQASNVKAGSYLYAEFASRIMHTGLSGCA